MSQYLRTWFNSWNWNSMV